MYSTAEPPRSASLPRWRSAAVVSLRLGAVAMVCLTGVFAGSAGAEPLGRSGEAASADAERSAELLAGAAETPDSLADLRKIQDAVRRVVVTARPATVAVELDDSIGSGVIVSPDGLVLTAGHVSVEPNRRVTIRFADNREVAGLTLGINHDIDSGLVQITDDPPTSIDGAADAAWPHVPIADVTPRLGEWVIGLGQPNGFVVDRAPPVRLGRVLYQRADTINTDATLVGGDSGGPLLNLRGEVIGIHSRIGQKIASNFHVPVGSYQREWDRLLAGRMRGVPEGESAEDWRPSIGVAARETPDGVVVTQVFSRSPAAEAGVESGDVLVRFAGRDLSTLADAAAVVAQQEAFDRQPLVVSRAGTAIELEVWLGRSAVDFPGADLVAEGTP